MGKKATIGASIVLDGEKEFREAVTACNKKLTAMRSEMNLVKETYAENANSLEALQAKNQMYSKILQEQKNKVEAVAKGHDHAVDVYNKVGTALNELKVKEEAAKQKLEEMRKVSNTSSKELEDQEKAVKELSTAVKNGEKKYQTAGNRIQDWKNKLNTANAQMIKADRELQTNKKYMQEAAQATDQCAKSIDRYGKKTREVTVNVEGMGQNSKEAFDALASTIVASGVIEKVEDVAETLYDCSEAAEEFEAASKKVSTIADKNVVSMEKMDEDMLALSSDTGKNAAVIAESTYQAISAGVDTSDSVKEVENANKLAVAGFTEMTTAIDVLTTSVNAYDLAIEESSRVSDVMITTQNLGKTSVADLGNNIGKVIPIAAAFNTDIENLGAAYARLTASGIKTEESTTYIKGMMNELGDSGSEVAKVLSKKTGKSFAELMKSGKSLGDVIGILGDSVNGNKTEFNNLWSSQEAGVGALTLLNAGTEKFNSTLEAMRNSTGATEEAFDRMSNTTETSKRKMNNAINNLKIAIGKELNTSLNAVYESGQNAFEWATDFVQENPAVVQAITAVATGIGVLGATVGAFTLATKVAKPAVEELTAAIASNPVGAIAVGIAAAVAALTTFIAMTKASSLAANEEAMAIKQSVDELKAKNEALKQSMENANQNRQASEAEVYSVEMQADRLMELNEIENKTKMQKLEMKTVVENLSTVIPGLTEAFNEETGVLRMGREEIEKKIESYKKLFLTQAAEEDLKELYKSQYEVEKAVASAEEKKATAANKVTEAKEKQEKAEKALQKQYDANKDNLAWNAHATKEFQEAEEANRELAKAKKEEEKATKNLNKEIKESDELVQENQEEIKTIEGYIENLGETEEKTKDKVEDSTDATKQDTAAKKENANAVKEAGQAVEGFGDKIKYSGQKAIDKLIDGMKSRKENLQKTASELGNILISTLDEKIEMMDLKTNGNGYTAKEEMELWKGVMDATEERSEEWKAAYKKFLQARNRMRNEQKEQEEKAREAAEKAREEAKKKAEKAREAAEKKEYKKVTKAQEQIERHEAKTGKEYSAAKLEKIWKGVMESIKKGTEAYKDAKKNYQDAQKEAAKALREKTKEEYKSLREEIKELKSAYDESVNSLKESILSSYNLFSKPELTRTSNAEGLLKNLRQQAETIQQWGANLRTLKDRGVSSALLKELQEMGLSSAGDVATLASMTDAQLQEYQQYYNQRKNIAKIEATAQNEDLLADMQEKIKEAQKKSKKKLQSLMKTYQEEVKRMGVDTSKIYANGIEIGSKDVVKAISKMTGEAVKKIKKDLGIHSPSKVFDELGGYTGLGFAQGLQRETMNLSKILQSNLPETVPVPKAASNQTGNSAADATKIPEKTQLAIYIDSRMVGSAVYPTVDLMNGAAVRLAKRGVINNG